MVAHAEEFYYTAFGNRTDVKLIPTIVAQTRRSGAYVTPNLSAFEAITKQWGHPEQVAEYLRDVRAQFMTPAVRTHWINKDYVKRQGDLTAVLAFLREFTKALQDGGVPLLTGTDSPDIPGVSPGYSIHDDLRTLLASGLSPFQALQVLKSPWVLCVLVAGCPRLSCLDWWRLKRASTSERPYRTFFKRGSA
jgi:hypothetical protein